MRIAVVHDAVAANSPADQADAIIQAHTVSRALASLGHKACILALSSDFGATLDQIRGFGADIVFNLVESLEGSGRLIHLFPFFLEAKKLAFTGAGAEAMMLTSSKVAAKSILNAKNLPTPDWAGPFPSSALAFGASQAAPSPGRWIVKSVWEHASIGLDENSIFEPSGHKEITARLQDAHCRMGGDFFAEKFIDGREFNLSILASEGGRPMVLPPAEIIFEGYGPDRAKIVDYKAKWDETSYEFSHTPRSFDFPKADSGLLDTLKSLALSCWQAFNLAGYARVDFRVDEENRPFILEINANPCLSPDAGFAAALKQAGISFEQAVAIICKNALTPLAQEIAP
ncbi:MAG: D-alanine--D-alanine ligase [Desulfatibacillaceae bacterium]|nr:D-alanine--D-alanine ligase [Desulfatibacillaceae bacterium]